MWLGENNTCGLKCCDETSDTNSVTFVSSVVFFLNNMNCCPQLSVLAQDSGIPPMGDKVTVLVKVARNLNAPYFLQSLYNVSVLETAEPNLIIAEPKITDKDGVRSNVLHKLTRFCCHVNITGAF